jgi:cation diffusion facilitator CzcD-associated flavoprotein CzcO
MHLWFFGCGGVLRRDPRWQLADHEQAAAKHTALHSARWPQNAVFEGQRVAVIGTGASAIQVVPELAKHAKELTVYQRSAPYVLPKATINMSDTSSERARVFAELEKVALSRSDFAMTAKAQSAFLAYLTDQVPDPVLRSKLTPSYILGCKRTLFSDHWYPALQRCNVHLETEPIRKISPNEIFLNDGTKRQVDCIFFATGFNPSNYLQGIKVV